MALTGNKVKVVEQFNYADRDVVAGAIHIYRGSLMNADTSGNIKLASDTATELFAGVAMCELDQGAAALAADNQMQLLAKDSGVSIKVKMTGATKADIGKAVFAVDDETVALVGVTTNDVEVGVIVNIDAEADYVIVKL